MRPTYNGIKYYGKYDLSISYELAESAKRLKAFDYNKKYTDINEIIELYNIKSLFDLNINLDGWTEQEICEYRNSVKSLKSIISKFFNLIDDSNFEKYESLVCINYYEDFWELFEKYKSYEKVSPQCFKSFISKEATSICSILKHKQIVNYYDGIIAEVLTSSNQTADILISKFMREECAKYYLPKELKKEKFDGIFERYIDSEIANPNQLRLIYLFQSTGECPISDKTKYKAKKRYDDYFNNQNMNSKLFYEYTIQVSFKPQNNIKELVCKDREYNISFDSNWLEQHLDYPTILNNFIYVFELVDSEIRSVLPAVETMASVFERTFSQNGIKFYPENTAFRSINQTVFLSVVAYVNFLKQHKIEVLDVFKWFFEEYLKEEFLVNGFVFNTPSINSSYGDKCLKIAVELESILKQFKMYVEDGDINRELYEFSSSMLEIQNIPSLVKNKYAYPKGEEIHKISRLLFSDQTALGFIKDLYNYKSLFELITHENTHIDLFDKRQREAIKYLTREKVIKTNAEDKLIFDNKVVVLKDLYEHVYLSVYHIGKNINEVSNFIDVNFLETESKLFSRQESDFYNYILNKSKFSNGPDLRNKYAHGNGPLNEKEQYNDYIQMLILMITTIIKINDEFVLQDGLKGGGLYEL